VAGEQLVALDFRDSKNDDAKLQPALKVKCLRLPAFVQRQASEICEMIIA
jgi:hypothetical protein